MRTEPNRETEAAHIRRPAGKPLLVCGCASLGWPLIVERPHGHGVHADGASASTVIVYEDGGIVGACRCCGKRFRVTKEELRTKRQELRARAEREARC